MPGTGQKDQALITGRIAYGWDGSNAYPLKANSAGYLATPQLLEHIEHPFGKGALTADGVQYGAETTISSTAFAVVPAAATITLPAGATVAEFEFGLTGNIFAADTATTGRYKWQGSDDNAAWEDLIAAQSTAATAATDFSIAGRFAPTGNFLGASNPFYVRMVAAQSTGAGNITAKVKSSSYIKVVYKTW